MIEFWSSLFIISICLFLVGSVSCFLNSPKETTATSKILRLFGSGLMILSIYVLGIDMGRTENLGKPADWESLKTNTNFVMERWNPDRTTTISLLSSGGERIIKGIPLFPKLDPGTIFVIQKNEKGEKEIYIKSPALPEKPKK